VIPQARALVCLLAAVLVVAGCERGTAPPSGSASPTSATASAATQGSSADPGTPAPGQTDTGWGRIWDEVPESFPLYPGGLPAGGTSESVSAALVIDGVEAQDVASWMQMQLERTTLRTEGYNGPLEDGSFVLDTVGGGGCRIQVKAAPLGSLTSLIVRYGAACPAP
jgi:hypothetical protein